MESHSKKTQKKQKKKNKVSKKNKESVTMCNLKEYTTNFKKLKEQFRKNEISKIAFEEFSTQLLLKVDAIETNGIEKVRNCRKELVIYINSILEEN
jgi:hypothetical protein